jgi:putative membrane protein
MTGVAAIHADMTAATRGEADWAQQRLPATLAPHANLLRYYLLSALMFGPGWFIAALPFYFRYRTLRYEIDAEGITMRWGILFRREVSLTYARIQDIQLTSNVVERWLGLARIQLQTASGSASAEMTIEGLRDADAMRDFLYSRMRGARDDKPGRATATRGAVETHRSAPSLAVRTGEAGALRTDALAGSDDALGALTSSLEAAAEELRALRLELTRSRP